jgi:hypothetical protein
LLVVFTLLMLATAYPVMAWLVAAPTFSRLLLVELWLSFLYGSYNGAMVVFLTEIMPIDVHLAVLAGVPPAASIFGGFRRRPRHRLSTEIGRFPASGCLRRWMRLRFNATTRSGRGRPPVCRVAQCGVIGGPAPRHRQTRGASFGGDALRACARSVRLEAPLDRTR